MARDFPLTPELQKKWGHLRFIQYKGSGDGGGEWSSECPNCLDADHVGNDLPDRFHMHGASPAGNARGKCRRCGWFEWADQDITDPPDPARILEQQELARKAQAREHLRLKAKIARLQEEAYYKGWHDSMTSQQRVLWAEAGIPNEFQDHWELGYREQYKGISGGAKFQSRAQTIPYFNPGRRPFNIQYRLLDPPKANDRYRFGKGFSTGLWLSDPDEVPEGACLLCEGVKKAAVAFIEIVAKLNRPDLTVVSAPAKNIKLEILHGIENCDPIWIAFDPDAYEPVKMPNGDRNPPAIHAVYKYLVNGGHDVRLVKLPMKLDDMLMVDGIDGSYVVDAMKRARHL